MKEGGYLSDVELVPGVFLDEEEHPHACALLAGASGPVFAGLDARSVVGLVDLALAAVEALPPHQRAAVRVALAESPCPLSPCVGSEAQAATLAASIWGIHRVDPTGVGGQLLELLETVGELVASPTGSADLATLEVLALLARSRWRGRGRVRSGREPWALLAGVEDLLGTGGADE